jgi:DNA repair exonuclease SbcCD ATPase subunit
MIPHRVKLAGFLSYKDEQDVRFDGSAVWMLAGTNGSGKSSIFDAVTYALFGHHRGGSQNAAELINKESAGLSVEFDFKLDGKLYRIKRTLRRSTKGAAAGTQQVFAQKPDSPDSWEAVPDTNKKVDFDRWVSEKIGLSYDIFTSSVLLLQGKAEKLLDSKPSGRAEVLAGIVDLARYQRLHEKANAKKLELKSKLDTLSAQTEGVPDVSDLEFAAAVIKIDECEQAREAAQKAIDDAQATEGQARLWADAEARRTAAKQKLTQAEAVLSDAVKIEKEHGRLVELRSVLPAVNTVVTVRGQQNESQRRAEKLAKDREDATERKSKAEAAADQARRQRELQAKRLKDDEGMLEIASKKLRELAGVLQTVRLVEAEETKRRQHADDLKQLPRDPEADVAAAKAEEARLIALERVLPILERVQTERHELTQAIRKEAESKKLRDHTAKAGKDAKTDGEKLKADVEAARQAKAKADGEVAVAKTLADQAAAAVAEFNTLGGAKECRACGQPLTPAHFKDEKGKREAEVKTAEARLKKAQAEAKTAAERERDLTEKDAAHTKQLEILRDEYKDHDATWKQSSADIKRLTDSLYLRYAEMPEPFRTRIAAAPPDDWTATRYPERDELANLRRELGQLDATRRTVRDADATVKKWNDLRTRVDAADQNLKRLKQSLPSDDVTALRQEHTTLQTQETTLTNGIRAMKQALETLDRDIDKAGREAHMSERALIDIVGKVNSEKEKQDIHRETLDRTLKQLPEAWRAKTEMAGLTEYSTWKAEQDGLEAGGVEAKFRQLEQARGGLAALRDDLAKRDAEADAFPPEVRKPADEVKAAVVLARKLYDDRDKDLRAAVKHKDQLESHREQRARLGEQWKETDAAHAKYKVLTELLGRDRLQRHLVRQAERQIVDYANAVLDRLSGGQLMLKLVGTDDGADKALDLECSNRVTGGAPINVTFLSGSQRFRVAVSLALAIGQYASRQHRPIESVIIDEGFGCLDRQGRQVMIQELQNLRGHLHCILLVSHQEEFADAFADGYRFELQDGATKVSRFQR